ncbi:hypothetical protein BC834DRAFT_900225 [Gloeopeniophorella convolvens]|nr:hypothetical protein BC834DRAFT_900225 [Gloeopeniophorella convolvens]
MKVERAPLLPPASPRRCPRCRGCRPSTSRIQPRSRYTAYRKSPLGRQLHVVTARNKLTVRTTCPAQRQHAVTSCFRRSRNSEVEQGPPCAITTNPQRVADLMLTPRTVQAFRVYLGLGNTKRKGDQIGNTRRLGKISKQGAKGVYTSAGAIFMANRCDRHHVSMCRGCLLDCYLGDFRTKKRTNGGA